MSAHLLRIQGATKSVGQGFVLVLVLVLALALVLEL
jgi:hypothetical protein